MSGPSHELVEVARALATALGIDLVPKAPPAPPRRTLLTVAEMAERLGVAVCTVRTMCAEGMPHKRPRPRLIRIDPSEADAWIESRRVTRDEARRRGRIDARKAKAQAH